MKTDGKNTHVDAAMDSQQLEKAKAAVMQTLATAETQGNVYLPIEDMIRRCHARHAYLTNEQIRFATLVSDKRLYLDNDVIARENTMQAENKLAAVCAKRLAEKQQDSDTDWGAFVSMAAKELNIALSNAQFKAAVGALSNSTSIITGGAGSGKTTLLKVICRAFWMYCEAMQPDECDILNYALLMAPTGKAARRLSQQAGLSAYTIHSVIFTGDTYSVSHFFQQDGSFKAPLIIVDETSMVDTSVMYGMMKSLSEKNKVIFVGDPHQLPAVGPGLVLNALIGCGFPTFKLTDNFRLTANHNALARNIDQIRAGISDLEYDESFRFIPSATNQDIGDAMIQTYVHSRLLGHDVQMLSPAGKTPYCGVDMLNRVAQAYLNPETKSNPGVKLLGVRFRVGDRIVQLINNKHGRNGDTGDITAIAYSNPPIISVRFDTGNEVKYTADEIVKDRLLAHAYALTVHKAQGSEYDYVIIPMDSAQSFMWTHNMVYTAISRARKGVILIGHEFILRTGINRPLPNRNTQLLRKIKYCNEKTA